MTSVVSRNSRLDFLHVFHRFIYYFLFTHILLNYISVLRTQEKRKRKKKKQTNK